MAEKDKDETEHVYQGPRLNMLFAVSGILLTLAVVWMIWADYSRDWKRYQAAFNRMEVNKTRTELKQTRSEVETAELKQIRTDLAQANKDLRQHEGQLKKLGHSLTGLKGKLYAADQSWRFARAVYDVDRYEFEEKVRRGEPHLEKQKGKLDRKAGEIAGLDDRVKSLKAGQDSLESAIGEIEARRDSLRSRVSKATDRATVLDKKLTRIKPGFVSAVLNAPLLDFMNPTLRVKQILVPDLTFDVNFAGAQRVDRCTTCHLSIDKAGYEDAPQPFRTHPHLETFLGSSSGHPIDNFGCTTCHGGSGWATDFVHAEHTPKDEAEAKAWEKKYGWHEDHEWDYPMYRSDQIEAACLKCHYEQQPHIPQAPTLNQGMELIEKSGCYGCHELRGYGNLRKVGPSLERIAEKVSPEWAYRWISNPTSFTEHARMPRFFGVVTQPTPEIQHREETEVAALTAFIMNASTTGNGFPAPPPGNLADGRELVNQIGCKGCHIVDEPGLDLSRSSPRRFGPELSASGSKLTPGWIYAWIKDPSHYWARTRMPNLRLSDREAADITAYLSSLRNPSFEAEPVAAADPAVLDQIAMESLVQHMTSEDARTKAASMASKEKELYVGDKLVSRYGCFGCHDIKGFENAQTIGTSLTTEGSKKVARLDFGLVEDIPQTTPAWITQKLLDPRIYDRGRVKKPEERLKMPRFGFSEDEARAITVAILGYNLDKIPPYRRVEFSPEQALVQRGVWLTEERNCIGCHLIGERGAAIRATLEDQGYWPPPLTGEGAKVRSEWLFTFLHGPTPIRPWLKVRMPTFGFSDDEVNTVIRYFASDAGDNYFVSDPHQAIDPANLDPGKTLFTQFQCLKCHDQVHPVVSPADRAPDLGMADRRLRPEWIVKWLRDPQAVQEGTRMPTFFYDGVSPNQVIFSGNTDRQLAALRDYILTIPPSGGR